MAFRSPPATRKGGFPLCDVICAPIAESGLITRSIGRRDKDLSPILPLKNFCPATMPLNIRIVEPEFPQSSETFGSTKDKPRPCTSITSPATDSLLRSHATPSARMHPSVLAQSAPVE